jgi:2'-5' RNA ligase
LKTRQPVIVTARIAERDIERFDRLRQRHFPPGRNFLNAHLTMFHRLPGEYRDTIEETLEPAAAHVGPMKANVSGVRHLGAGVAYVITCSALEDMRERLKTKLIAWLVSQDMQTWRPHITIQNKVSKSTADALYRNLKAEFQPHSIEIIGVDLWNYLGGPWEHLTFVPFHTRPADNARTP